MKLNELKYFLNEILFNFQLFIYHKMNGKIENNYTEIVLDDNCEWDKLYEIADILTNKYKIKFIAKINDFDTVYWDFKYKQSTLTLHYNIYLGVSIFPRNLELSTDTDNANTIEISNLLLNDLKNEILGYDKEK